MRLTKRSSYESDEALINELLKKETNRKKTKFTDVLCSLLNYFSLIPTLIYSAIWFVYLKSTLDLFIHDEALIGNIQGCMELYHWVNYALSWTIISFLKAVFLLTCIKFCCGGENDCNICCLVLKCTSTVIPSIIFVLHIPDYVNKYKNYNSNILNLTKVDESLKHGCDNMANVLSLYYKWEFSYMIFVLFTFCVIPAGALCMCFKEIWKSRGYNKEE